NDPADVADLRRRQSPDRRRLHAARSADPVLRLRIRTTMSVDSLPQSSIPITSPLRPRFGFLTSTPIIAAATILLTLIVLVSILPPLIAPHDPIQLAPSQRLKPASAQFLLGTDAYGRDLLSRVIYGGRISLLIGIGSAILSIA